MHAKPWMNLQRIMSSEKKPDPKGYILCGTIYTKLSNDKSIEMVAIGEGRGTGGRQLSVAIRKQHKESL